MLCSKNPSREMIIIICQPINKYTFQKSHHRTPIRTSVKKPLPSIIHNPPALPFSRSPIHPPIFQSTHHFSFSSSLRSQATNLSVTWFWRLYSTNALAALTDSSPVLTRAVPICGFWFGGWGEGMVRGEWG